jgi:hypothetical protein
VVHSYNPSTGVAEDHEYEVNWGYVGRPFLKKKKKKSLVTNLLPEKIAFGSLERRISKPAKGGVV